MLPPSMQTLVEKIADTFPQYPRLPKMFADTLSNTYATTLHGLQEVGALKAGETLLVLGASGGVGTTAISGPSTPGCRTILYESLWALTASAATNKQKADSTAALRSVSRRGSVLPQRRAGWQHQRLSQPEPALPQRRAGWQHRRLNQSEQAVLKKRAGAAPAGLRDARVILNAEHRQSFLRWIGRGSLGFR